jgi:ankyrin repeat protein
MEIWWRFYCFLGVDLQESVICPPQFSHIHVAAYLGLDSIIPALMTESSYAIFNSRGRAPLWWACSMGHASTSAVLLKAGFDPNTPDHD